jgi:hypothetical protein
VNLLSVLPKEILRLGLANHLMFDLTGVRAGEFRKGLPGGKLPGEPGKARETTCLRARRNANNAIPWATGWGRTCYSAKRRLFMSKINGEKARAAVNKRRRTAQRAKDRSKRAELQKNAEEEAPKAQEK